VKINPENSLGKTIFEACQDPPWKKYIDCEGQRVSHIVESERVLPAASRSVASMFQEYAPATLGIVNLWEIF